MVDRITTGKRGIAESKPLPVGIYAVREIAAPVGYLVNETVFWAEIKVHEDLVRFEVEDGNEETNVTIQKIGNVEAMPGDVIRYDLTNISNASNVELDDFYIRDVIPTDALRLEKIVTGRWSERLTYRVEYKTNYRDWRTLKGNLSTQVSHTLDCGREALGLRADECITQVRFRFGTVQPGFHDLDGVKLYCTVRAGLPSGYRFTNCADAGGERNGEWTIEKDCWTTVTWDKLRGKLPKTGL